MTEVKIRTPIKPKLEPSLLFHPIKLLYVLVDYVYIVVQLFIIAAFKPPLPPKKPAKYRGRIAVVGAGLTGISSAAHAAAHGFDVVIYEQKDSVGGIWANVNRTSGLQLNSMLYRFHPGVRWSKFFPHRDEIVGEIRRIWKEYKLDEKTRLKTPVTKVTREPRFSKDPKELDHARWVVNDGQDGIFDAVIVTVGTCGKPNKIPIDGLDWFGGQTYHSSELDNADLKDKKVVIIGSGASGVEAAELAVEKQAQSVHLIARDDKWIIPRNIVFDTLLSAQPFGRETPLSFIPEAIISNLHYRDLKSLTPARLGIFEGTPVVNNAFLGHIRAGKISYVRGDTLSVHTNSVAVSVRSRESKPGDNGREKEFDADVIVLATGFHKPELDFLPEDLFPNGYNRPNLYLQNFSTEDWSILCTNSSYMNAIGTVGHFHIGIYTRILLVLLMDKNARPLPKDMKLWVDVLGFVKRGARGGALGFFTYMELTIWFILFHLFRPDRLRWILFIMQGWGVPPLK